MPISIEELKGISKQDLRTLRDQQMARIKSRAKQKLTPEQRKFIEETDVKSLVNINRALSVSSGR